MTHTALADAAEMRRRELPASLALTILVGGLAAAIMGGSLPVGWAAIVALILIFDCELYRRLEAAGRPLTPSLIAALAAWAGFGSAFYVVLPAALWLDGQAAGAAAAIRAVGGGGGSAFQPWRCGRLADRAGGRAAGCAFAAWRAALGLGDERAARLGACADRGDRRRGADGLCHACPHQRRPRRAARPHHPEPHEPR
ncbi:MAG: hypothetical protein NVV62_17990 [Terricaulis sp.]|nr:hypothetical protein [Terricaulis sp.]